MAQNVKTAARSPLRVALSVAASDGAGVNLRRSLGSTQMMRHDPGFLLSAGASALWFRAFPGRPGVVKGRSDFLPRCF